LIFLTEIPKPQVSNEKFALEVKFDVLNNERINISWIHDKLDLFDQYPLFYNVTIYNLVRFPYIYQSKSNRRILSQEKFVLYNDIIDNHFLILPPIEYNQISVEIQMINYWRKINRQFFNYSMPVGVPAQPTDTKLSKFNVNPVKMTTDLFLDWKCPKWNGQPIGSRISCFDSNDVTLLSNLRLHILSNLTNFENVRCKVILTYKN